MAKMAEKIVGRGIRIGLLAAAIGSTGYRYGGALALVLAYLVVAIECHAIAIRES